MDSINTAASQNLVNAREAVNLGPKPEELQRETIAQTNSSPSEKESVQVARDIADKENSERQEQDVVQAAQEVETFLQMQNRSLSFALDDKTDRSVVTVKDTESGDVIRQIPSEEVLRLAERIKSLNEDLGSSVGVLFSNRV